MKALRVALLLGLFFACDAQTQPLFTDSGFNEQPTPTSETPQEATYWVTFNTNLRPGQTMFFNVLIRKGTSVVKVTASLLDSQGKKVILQSMETDCTPGQMQVIPIEVPLDVEKPSSQRWENYQVRVVGEGLEVNFIKDGYANLREKAFSTFIQTDKAMYKPRQEVKFRVVSIDPQLQVMRDAIYDIVVKDAKNNRILHLRNVNASKDLGVVQSSFRLADLIPTGDWRIEVTVLGFEEVKTFTVLDYVLPKFEVEIDAPVFGVINDTHLNFTVKAKYTFGKPVSDSPVLVTIKGLDYEWYYRPQNGKHRPSVILEGRLDRDGKYQVNLPIKNLVKLVQHYQKGKNDTEWQRFVINATVTEARTNKTQHAEHELQYFATPLKMEFLGITPDSYKAGLNFTAYLEVRKRDGSLFTPEEASKIKIKFNVTYEEKIEPPTMTPPTRPSNGTASNDLEESATAERALMIGPPPYFNRHVTKVLELSDDIRNQTLPGNGWLVIRFGIPSSAVSFRIHAESDAPYSRIDHAYFYGNPANSPSYSFLQLNVTNHKPKVNDVITIKAKATEKMRALFYQITAKGILLKSQNVTPPSPSKEIEFEFPVESSMSPNMNLLAFFVREDGEFVVDALSLSVEGLFANSVEVKFSKDKVQPGETVDVVVKGKENSMVFLLAVDKSVKLLKSGNDITQELVRQELLKYEFGDNYGPWRFMFVCGWPSYYSGTDAASVFSSAGVQVLTDGLVYRKPYFVFDNDGILESAPEVAATTGPGATQEKNPGDTASSEKEEPRSNFLEIMFWDAVTIPEQSNGEVSVSLSAPDTITSWVASVFSSHPTDGLSIGAEPAEVITFKDLFVNLDLPSFIVRHEVFCFTASVFNYYNKDVNVWVTMEKSADFRGMHTTKDDKSKNVTVEKKNNNYNVILGKMKEGDIKSTRFCITPEVLGIIIVKVTVHTNINGLSDSVEHKLRVKPEGAPRSITKPYLVSLLDGQWSEDVSILFPPRTVAGSGRITINVAGNLLASVFENMDSLVKQPYGCGEQNMVNFAPLISLLKFFTASGKLNSEIEKKILDFMQQGYQREMTYEHDGGGYSTFGDRGDAKPSTWLTAFVLKCFAQAHQFKVPFIDDESIIRSALWISKMNRGGAFVEMGKVFNKRLQGGSGAGQALTAYTVIALHEAAEAVGQNSSHYNNIIVARDKGVAFLETTLSELTDPYDICITAYALHLVGSKKKDDIFNKMEDNAIISLSGLKHWERKEKKTTTNYYWTRQTDAISIEMTSYALLTYYLRGVAFSGVGFPVINWLSQQKSANGGFISTQDTVTGIEALANLLSAVESIPMDVTVTAGIHSKTFDINKKNEMLFQKFEIPEGPITYNISLQASAKDSSENSPSTVLVEVAQYFNVEEGSESDQYKIESFLMDDTLYLMIQTIDGEMSGMALLEIDLPSGYGVEVNKVEELNPIISKVEWKDEDVLSLYFQTDVIGPRPIKVQIPLIQSGGVMPVTLSKNIKFTNYYEPDSDLTISYKLTERPFCDIAFDFGLCPFVN